MVLKKRDMKLGIGEINKTIQDCKSMGFDLRMADIMYVFAFQGFKDKNIVYATLFGKGASDSVVNEYDSSKKIKFLKKYMRSNFFKDSLNEPVSKKEYEDITFEENKEALIKLLGRIQTMATSGEIEKKDAVKLETDIRTKLNDKFAVSEKQDEQRVVVLKKYNDICVCGREIYRPTRDDIIEDLKKEYDLVPKKKDNGNE